MTLQNFGQPVKQRRDFRLTQYRWRGFLQRFLVVLKIKANNLREKNALRLLDAMPNRLFDTYIYQSLQSRYITIFRVYYRGHDMSTFQLLRGQIWRWRWERRRSLSSLLHALKLYHSTILFVDLRYHCSMNILSNELFRVNE